MPIWPFRRGDDGAATPEALRDRLIAAADGPPRKLRALCARHKDQVAAHIEFLRKPPPGIVADPAAFDRYVRRLGAVAHCLATECGAPELWRALRGTPESNPLIRWEQWYAEFPDRVGRLEYDALIAEARAFVAEARTMQGRVARQQETFLLGRLGQLLFHSGRVAESLVPLGSALAICREIGDAEGEFAHLGNLLEAHRYRGEVPEAIALGEEIVGLCERHGRDARAERARIRRLDEGEPLCRIVCTRDGGPELELDELDGSPQGRYQFGFRRNRLSLMKAEALVRQGNALASAGQLAEALGRYREASEVDPHDPDPVYQSGMCLLELGEYARAREAYETVERLAPGWFRCRADRWLAGALDEGVVGRDEFGLLRGLEDGGLQPEVALDVARKAVETFPDFAPFYMILGDLLRDGGDKDAAIRAYRDGLVRVAEPDLETRLSCALAGLLPRESPERRALLERAIGLEGNLVARAAVRMMGLA